MSDDLDQPATKRDLLDLRTELRLELADLRKDLDHRLDMLNVRLDAYWTASDRVQRLAFSLLITAWASILGTFVAILLRR